MKIFIVIKASVFVGNNFCSKQLTKIQFIHIQIHSIYRAMKRALIIIQIIVFSQVMGYTQIQYKGKYDANLKVFQTEDGVLKLYKINTQKNQLLIFNEDISLWRTVNLKTPEGHIINDIELLEISSTENNKEMKILFTCYYNRHYTIEDVSEYFSKQIFTLNIIDENGDFLLQIPDAKEYKVLSANGNNRLLVYKNERSGFKSSAYFDIYGF